MSEKEISSPRGSARPPKGPKDRDYVLVPRQEYQQFLQWSESKFDIAEFIAHLWQHRWFIAKVTSAAVVIGVVLSLLMKPEYTSTATLLPEYSTESSMGGSARGLLQNFGGLMGAGGGTYSSNSNAIRVELYPNIVASIPFQLELLEGEYYLAEHDTTTSLYTYYNSIYEPSILSYVIAYTIRLPFTIKDWITGESGQRTVTQELPLDNEKQEILSISKEKMDLINMMQAKVFASLDQESGVISVQASMPTPELSAAVAKRAVDSLTSYLAAYRKEKLKVDLQYIEEQHEKAERRFHNIQDSLATFRDRNTNVVTATAQTREQQLQSEYDLANNLYQSLTQQLEQKKLRLMEETPVFQVLEPVQVPLEKSSPNRTLIVLGFILLGGMGSVGYVLLRKWITYIRETLDTDI